MRVGKEFARQTPFPVPELVWFANLKKSDIIRSHFTMKFVHVSIILLTSAVFTIKITTKRYRIVEWWDESVQYNQRSNSTNSS